MNNFKLINAAIILVAFMTSLHSYSKSALLVTHYGSSDDTTRSLTIDRITEDMRRAFPSVEVREAYISPVVRRNLEKKGLKTDSPVDALLRLQVEGFDSVYVQSTTIIDGIEMEEVRKSVRLVAPFFAFVKVGNSLLFTPDDCSRLVEILADYPSDGNQAIVYVGHGNDQPSTATYTQLDYMFHLSGLSRFHVSTIEGFPDVNSTITELSADKKLKKVTLLPLLLVCGNHTKQDIAGDFADALRKKGYRVETILRGLAELPAVRKLYVEKARKLIEGEKI